MVEQKNPNKRKVFVVGNGMTRFYKPGSNDLEYHDLSQLAIERALRDAGIGFSQIQAAYTGWIYGNMCEAQRGIYKVGKTSIPIINSNNNGATGGTALYMTWVAVRSGAVDCALTLGFDQMEPGALKEYWPDRVSPT